MISDVFKPAVTRVITPTAKAMLKVGLTPNGVTALGGVGVIASSLIFYPSSHFFFGTILICIFALSDLFDGTMARISNRGSSPWGSFLDSTMDRITDSSILIGLLLALNKISDPLVPVILVALVTGMLVPYIRAKAESLNIECSGGIAERTERLMLALFAIGFHGLGIPFVLSIGIWVLTLLSLTTVIQRALIVRRALNK
ncbi:MAG: CDP-alcohol phosphatidyltransferase family protein [Streptomycetaceae bacterium]|nr:MAG: CDP-alcohol phosphatidyltransferase family protein [Streptomycetaceae bacterium]